MKITCVLFKKSGSLLLGLLALSLPLQAAGSNALDRINFGDTGTDAYSESVHNFNSGLTGTPLTDTGALGQTYRAPVGGGPGTGTNELAFTMTVSSTLQNYITVRLWGSDHQSACVWLSGANFLLDDNGGPPSFPNRFYYSTIAIPLSMTTGKTSVSLVLYESNTPDTSFPGRPVYSAYTHTDPHFMPDGNDPTGTKMAQTGQAASLPALTNAVAVGTTSSPGLLLKNRQNLYSVSNNYYSQVLARQIPAGQAGAPPETIGLDLGTNVATWAAANPNATADQWRDLCTHTEGPGYSANPDELMSVLISSYQLPQFTDANGTVVTGLDHYHDSTLITAIVSALDGCTYMYGVDGSFQEHGGAWCGLTSTPRATGHAFAGTTARNGAWSISLEGCDTCTIGTTIIKLLNDSTAASTFKNYLSQSANFNLDGTSVLRATAYEQMLYNHLNYLKSNLGGGTESQGLFSVIGIYATQIALEKLQALYPNSSYPALAGSTGISFVTQITGIAATTSQMGNLYNTTYANYGISAKGVGEAHGTLSSGYDGRYGSILPWITVELAELAALDPSMDSTTLGKIRTQVAACVNEFSQFLSPQEDLSGLTNYFTFAQEDFITYRDYYNANADAGGFNFGVSAYQPADPAMNLNIPYAKRSVYLETQYGLTPGTGAGGFDSLQYLRWLGSYEASVRNLINVSPTSLTTLPGEPGHANSAWVDPQTGTTSIYYNGERFYMNTNWDSYETAGNKWGVLSYLARIHDTLSASDWTALVYLPHDSTTQQSDGNLSGGVNQPWVVRYDNWLLMGNNGTTSASLKLPTGAGVALDVISGSTYSMGSTVTVKAGTAVAMALPLVTSSQPLPNGNYTMTNLASNLVLDDPGSSTTSGAQMDQNTATGGNNQLWTLAYNGSGYYTIKCVASGLYLTDPSGSTGNGAQLQQKTADNGNDQLWQLISSGSGYFFVNKAGGTEINDPGSSTTAGKLLVLWSLDSGKNSVWALQSPAVVSQPLANGTYTMTNDGSGLVLDDPGFSTTSGAAIDQWNSNGGTNQKWTFAYNGNGYYTVQCQSSGLYLTDPSGSTGNGTPLQQQTADGKSDQLWSLISDGAGYVLVNQAGNLDIDDPATSQTPGQTMVLYNYGGGPNQIWHIQ